MQKYKILYTLKYFVDTEHHLILKIFVLNA